MRIRLPGCSRLKRAIDRVEMAGHFALYYALPRAWEMKRQILFEAWEKGKTPAEAEQTEEFRNAQWHWDYGMKRLNRADRNMARLLRLRDRL